MVVAFGRKKCEGCRRSLTDGPIGNGVRISLSRLVNAPTHSEGQRAERDGGSSDESWVGQDGDGHHTRPGG